jgi:hypothetical protein
MGFNSSRDSAFIVAVLSNLHKIVDSIKKPAIDKPKFT